MDGWMDEWVGYTAFMLRKMHVMTQNNLGELHALFDLCCEGLLNDRRTFKRCESLKAAVFVAPYAAV
jgi:hypothetical protein